MTHQRLPINAVLATSGRRGGVKGEPAPHSVPPPADLGEPWLLDSREVARLLRIGRTKAFQLMAQHDLPVVRIGRSVRVPRNALRQWVKDRSDEHRTLPG